MDTEEETAVAYRHSRVNDNGSEMQVESSDELLSPIDSRRVLRADCVVLGIMTITMTLNALDTVTCLISFVYSCSHDEDADDTSRTS